MPVTLVSSVALAMPKSQTFYAPRASQEHVARLQVAVHDAERAAVRRLGVVGRAQRARHVPRDPDRDRGRHGEAQAEHAADQLGQRAAVAVLHRHPDDAVLLVHALDLHHVRVAEPAAEPRFPQQRVGAQQLPVAVAHRHQLQGELPPELARALALCEPHIGESAATQGPEEAERTDLLVGAPVHARAPSYEGAAAARGSVPLRRRFRRAALRDRAPTRRARRHRGATRPHRQGATPPAFGRRARASRGRARLVRGPPSRTSPAAPPTGRRRRPPP